jgi:hypothetical protein
MPSDAFADPMNETMTPQQAARVLTDAAGFERSLARRTHGLTLMMWGLASSGMFVSYGFAAVVDATWFVYAFLWAPWVFLGILTTGALWRSAALARPDAGLQWRDRREWTRVLLVGLGISAIFFLTQPDGPVLPLALLGAAYLVFALFNVFRSNPHERRDNAIAGALMLAIAGALAITRAPIEVSGLVSFATPALVLCGIGFYETLSG